MSQSERKQVRKRGCICFYNSQQIQEEPGARKEHFTEKMPMLSREQSSTIKFRNIEHSNKQPIYEILNDLYENHGSASRIYNLLGTKRINPVIQGGEERDDLEYFIPQIVTYMVIEKNLADEELTNFIIQACITDFYFAHRVYFYLNSLTEDHLGSRIDNVYQFLNSRFLQHMHIYSQANLSGIEFTKSMLQMDSDYNSKRRRKPSDDLNEPHHQHQLPKAHRFILKYGTKLYPNPPPLSPPVIRLPQRKRYCEHGFMQTPQFWEDLIEVGNKISRVGVPERNDCLTECIQEINEKLPANVYIPFFKDEIRLYTVLCVWKGRLFATKMRAPFSIWVEIYREAEEVSLSRVEEAEEEESTAGGRDKKKKNILEKIYETISRPFSIKSDKNTLNIKKDNPIPNPNTDKRSLKESLISSKPRPNNDNKRAKKKQFASFTNNQRMSISSVYEQDRDQNESKSERLSNSVASINQEPQTELCLDDYFGANANLHTQEVRSRSVYRQLKSWKLVHLMVKTGDDIKQEQFAMQLINRFQYIFKEEKLDCVVFPYEVISLGPDYGAIEMLNNVTTLNSLFEKLRAKDIRLSQLFRKAFPFPAEARRNFMRSLAGYSILTYFLQVKDRHNGNILLNREGYIIHIDFGFFLSNAPGKGVELEKKCPFKLISEYIEVLGGLNSEQFFEFRQLFFRGFAAVLKHRESIITLVKMMYSSHGESMGCFKKGEEAIEQLERRFSLGEGVESFCYDLINSSIDNWRARWYDKFQYFLQKIYY